MKRLGIALVIILINQALVQFDLFVSFMLFPIMIVGLTVVLRNYFTKNFYATSFFIILLLIINDLLIRKYAPGTHDQVGIALMNISFGINFIITGVLLLILYVLTCFEKSTKEKFLRLLFIIIIIGSTWTLFWYKLSNI